MLNDFVIIKIFVYNLYKFNRATGHHGNNANSKTEQLCNRTTTQ